MSSTLTAPGLQQTNPFAAYADLTGPGKLRRPASGHFDDSPPVTNTGLFLRIGLPLLALPVLVYTCTSYAYYAKNAKKKSVWGYLKFYGTCWGRFSSDKIVEEKRESLWRPSRWSTMPESIGPQLDKMEKYAGRKNSFDSEGQNPRAEFKNPSELLQDEMAEYKKQSALVGSRRPLESPLRLDTTDMRERIIPLDARRQRPPSLAPGAPPPPRFSAVDFVPPSDRASWSKARTVARPSPLLTTSVSRQSHQLQGRQDSVD